MGEGLTLFGHLQLCMQWGQTIQTIGWQIQNVILNLSNIVVEIDSGVMYNIGYENYNVNLCGNPLHKSELRVREWGSLELRVGELGVREFDRNGWMVRVVSWSSSF